LVIAGCTTPAITPGPASEPKPAPTSTSSPTPAVSQPTAPEVEIVITPDIREEIEPPTSTGIAGPEPLGPVIAIEPSEAERLIESGSDDRSSIDSIREYISQAEFAAPPQRQVYLLKATDALIGEGELDAAKSVLNLANMAELPPSFEVRKQFRNARISMIKDKPKTVLRRLKSVEDKPNLSPELHSSINELRAQAELRLDQKVDAVASLIEREEFLTSDEEILRNQFRIWTIVESTSPFELRERRITSSNPILSGWLELALINTEFGPDPYALKSELTGWRRDFPNHPANLALLNSLAVPWTEPSEPTNRIALLLPLTSKFSRAAHAFYEGFTAMHNANSDPEKPVIATYDTGEEASLSPIYYQLATREDADMIVGPLGKDAVNVLVSNGSLKVPTLLLGSVDTETVVPNNIYQFALQPEQEAQQTAVRVFLDGHRIAAILYPSNDWGQRMYAAFTEQWELLGGIVVESQEYNPDQSDHSRSIKSLLNIDESENRRRQLATVLGTKLDFSPRRRQDVDFIFLAADSKQGRLLKPQINFYHAHDLPVYATSHIFSGKKDPINDTDLNGVTFGDMPWMLREVGRVGVLRNSLQADWQGGKHTQLDRLYALGVDSYMLLPQLEKMRDDRDLVLDGVTASLAMTRNLRIQRRLVWARFEEGIPVLLDKYIDPKLLEQFDDNQKNLAPSTPDNRSLGGEESF